MKKSKATLLLSMVLITVMLLGNVAYAAPELSTPESPIEERRYEILDTITYGITFSGTTVNCYASLCAGSATKYVVSGMVQKKDSKGIYQYLCSWGEETTYGEICIFDKTCNAAGDGEYKFTLYVDIYKGSQCESLTFTKVRTR